ncbi:Cloroperoxidase [Polychaeton citri CBS 116435]|uniref:Cloroperoxidase n=1 Tax=Polychaeton citri CBS 116435 TaxID=1314669 RepID=A0A9P4QJ30_9PEZI|nr:Cloroperoxidase [Polychaeton citri CBS 116435]
MSRQDALGISKGQTNCGPTPCTTFDAQDQLVSLTGDHAYASPGPGDIRGPCPGLNAAANHGFLPRNGIASIEQTVSGLGALYNMGAELAAVLAAYAIALDGNVVEGVWSIGGPLPTDDLTGALLGTGQGISYSHNNYEGDGSIGRNDAYLNNGDAHSLNITKFEKVYAVGGPEDRYTLDKFRARFEDVQDESIANNPYYFTGAFSTVVVVPAAYNFVINFMSNHTVDEPSGYLDGYNFKTFFGVSGNPGSFKWQRGQERVPENWYRRPSTTPYSAADVFLDVGIGYAAYPKTLKFGGNTGKPNTFVGLDVADITGGVFNALTLTQGNNLACFSFSLLEQAIPDFLNDVINDLTPVTNLLNKYIGPIVGGLSCPQQGKYDVGLFDQFPGYKYKPNGPATNY